jgi:phosphoglycerate dehydrogenase-like enzyme
MDGPKRGEGEMNLLILESKAYETKRRLEPQFPEISIHAAISEAEVGDFIEKTDIILLFLISDELIKKAVNLKWIQSMITGVDSILSLPSLGDDVLLTSSRGIHGPQMSEIAFLFMLALNRNLYQNFRDRLEKKWVRWPGTLLKDKKVGVLGVGVIGEEIARKCKVFGMTVYGITRTKRENPYVDFAYGPEGILEVMSEVDYFINVVPSTPETRKMIGKKELYAMKASAYFINIGRGDTVDEDALIEVLQAEKIAGAALDVYNIEPLPIESPLWNLENVILTPHIGGMSDIYNDQVLPIFEENLRRFLKGERKNLINYIDRKV